MWMWVQVSHRPRGAVRNVAIARGSQCGETRSFVEVVFHDQATKVSIRKGQASVKGDRSMCHMRWSQYLIVSPSKAEKTKEEMSHEVYADGGSSHVVCTKASSFLANLDEEGQAHGVRIECSVSTVGHMEQSIVIPQ
ncbi:hypothetical protein VNO78_01800 [Psophocarpus tetragonolobus]|uniref:Uncharacterized protein n=1 Tax=Psophocarpus tetragonolobus TaxID=3891 RepID=A0AAN9SYL4_PSOTE